MRPPFWLWLGAVAAATTLPWSFVGHPHLEAIDWVPFIGHSSTRMAWIRDAPLNVLLFVPLGVLAQNRNCGLWPTLGFAFAVSLTAETFQVFCHGRFPSANDVVTNVCGAALGMLLAARTDSHRRTAADPVRARERVRLPDGP
jgi:glycopeptide antibiotics resistance protein